MEIRQLKYFQAIVKYNSFTEAAEECDISQSGISQQIQSLEKELGVMLFERHNRKFTVTEAGQYLYKKAVVLLNDLNTISNEVVKIGKRSGAHLNVGYIKSYGGYEFQRTLANFTGKYPSVKITVINGTHEELYSALKNDKVDIVLNDKRREASNDYVNCFIKEIPTYIEIASHSQYADFENIEVNSLKNTPCILVASKDQQLKEQEYYHDVVGFNGIFLFAENIQEGRMLVAANHGIMPIEGGIYKCENASIKFIPLTKNGKQVTKKYYAFWKTDNSGYYVEEFADMLKEEFS